MAGDVPARGERLRHSDPDHAVDPACALERRPTRARERARRHGEVDLHVVRKQAEREVAHRGDVQGAPGRGHGAGLRPRPRLNIAGKAAWREAVLFERQVDCAEVEAGAALAPLQHPHEVRGRRSEGAERHRFDVVCRKPPEADIPPHPGGPERWPHLKLPIRLSVSHAGAGKQQPQQQRVSHATAPISPTCDRQKETIPWGIPRLDPPHREGSRRGEAISHRPPCAAGAKPRSSRLNRETAVVIPAKRRRSSVGAALRALLATAEPSQVGDRRPPQLFKRDSDLVRLAAVSCSFLG